MLSICLGYFCTLACYLTLVGTWMNLNLWDCNPLTSWANIYITKSLHNGGWRQGSTQPFKHILWQILCWVSWLSFWIYKCSSLQELTHVGRWTQIPSGAPNSWWATSTLSNPHKFNYMIKINATTQGMLFHLREALIQVMSQSNSTRCEYIKMLKRKMVTPFWA